MAMAIIDLGTNFMSNALKHKCEGQGILVKIIIRDSQFKNGKTERPGGLFKGVHYRSKELAQLQSDEEVEILIHECSWALQTLINCSDYCVSQRMVGKSPIMRFILSDGKIYTQSRDEDQAFHRASELRFPKQAYIKVAPVNELAETSTLSRALTAMDFQLGDLEEVW
ncbi:unnamed protein product [Polarella glacialis]|uniref:Uncharacterized protein n=1 Tax=Polarella glacialis TaxID=89957 RepID=A0A813HDG2_POLGL|nr:unnamed protein product [Polarella glacialis]